MLGFLLRHPAFLGVASPGIGPGDLPCLGIVSRDQNLVALLIGQGSGRRRIGAAGGVHGLLRGDSIGLVTTHDLALTEIDRDLGSLAVNVHFEDKIEDGRVEFDYRLRPGIVTHSNALELMRAIGLEI